MSRIEGFGCSSGRVVALTIVVYLLLHNLADAETGSQATGSSVIDSRGEKATAGVDSDSGVINSAALLSSKDPLLEEVTVDEPATLSKSATNYASVLLGAKIVDFHESAKGVHQILNDDKDRYMQIPCSKQRKRLTIQLPREIEVNMFALSNDEFFSSSIKNFTVVGTREYPCRPPECMWRVLGTFQGQQTRDLQLFPVHKQASVRYVRLLWVSSHGSEKSCTMTRFQVFGVDVLDNLASELTQTIASSAADVDEEAKEDEDDEESEASVQKEELPLPINQTEDSALLETIEVQVQVENGTEVFMTVPVNVSILENSTLNDIVTSLNSQPNSTKVVSTSQTGSSTPSMIKRKKPKPPPPRVNISQSFCLFSDKNWEKASEEYTRYYEDGPGAICAVPTGEKKAKLPTTTSKLTAASMQLVLPQQQKTIKGVQVNITKLQTRLDALGEKLAQCRSENKDVLMKITDVEKLFLSRIETLEQQLRSQNQAQLAFNTENEFHRMESLRKVSDLRSHMNWWMTLLFVLLLMISLWVALTICSAPSLGFQVEPRLPGAGSEEELTSTGSRRQMLPRSLSTTQTSRPSPAGPSPNSLFPRLPQELRGSHHNLDALRTPQVSIDTPSSVVEKDGEPTFPCHTSTEASRNLIDDVDAGQYQSEELDQNDSEVDT